jgi:hypothetical protein
MVSGGRAERTCNAQATDDRNWLATQTLELHAQTIRCEEAGFAMHVFQPSFSPFQPDGSELAALCMSFQPSFQPDVMSWTPRKSSFCEQRPAGDLDPADAPGGLLALEGRTLF